MNVRPHVRLQNWMNEPLAGWMGKRTDGIGCGNASRSRPPTNDKRSPLQLPQVDPHLCAVACFSHPNLEITHRRNPQYSQTAFFFMCTLRGSWKSSSWINSHLTLKMNSFPSILINFVLWIKKKEKKKRVKSVQWNSWWYPFSFNYSSKTLMLHFINVMVFTHHNA